MQIHPTEEPKPQWQIILENVWEHFGGQITEIENLNEAQLIIKIKNLLRIQPNRTVSYFILQTLPIESAEILLEFDYFFEEKQHKNLLEGIQIRKDNHKIHSQLATSYQQKTKTAATEIASSTSSINKPSPFIRLLSKYGLPTVGNYTEQTTQLKKKVEATFNTPGYLESLLKDFSKTGSLDEFYLQVNIYTNWPQVATIRKLPIDQLIQRLIEFQNRKTS